MLIIETYKKINQKNVTWIFFLCKPQKNTDFFGVFWCGIIKN